MTNNELYDMYSEELTDSVSDNTSNQIIDVSKKGILTEVTIDGKTIEVVDQTFVYNLHRSIVQLQSSLKLIDQKIRNMQTKIGQLENSVQRIKSDLNNKVSYD